MRKLLYIIVFFVLELGLSYGQDPQFSQFYSNPLYLGPSFAGAIDGSRFTTLYRNQWPGLPVSFRTLSFGFDHYFSNFNSGVGILALRDMAGSGDLGVLNFGLQYSYNLQVFDTWHIRPGMHLYYTEMGLDYFNLRFYDEVLSDEINSPPVVTAPVRDKARDIDFSTSVLMYSERIWFGATLDHMLKPNLSLYADKYIIPYKLAVYGGFLLVKQSRLLRPIDETLTFAYQFKYQNKQKQLDLGFYWHKMPLVLGIWYRGMPKLSYSRGDAFTFLAGYKLENFSIGYSYDFTISNLLPQAWGAHELSVVFKFNMPPRKVKRGMVPCPEF